jgi:hypothetical protein
MPWHRLDPAAAPPGVAIRVKVVVEGIPNAMRQIRRAAVTGLFAIWLAPLSAVAEAPNGACCRGDRPLRAEAAVAPGRDEKSEMQDETRR